MSVKRMISDEYWPGAKAAAPKRCAKVIEFPASAETADPYAQPEQGTAEEFYIATQPYAPQWDWEFREF